MTDLRVAAAIPAYEAARSVGDVVTGVLEFLPDVLVVDDGSTDGTADAARAAGARVVSHGSNRGKGDALHTAFEDLFALGFDGVVTLDADAQHEPSEIPRLVAAAGGTNGSGADLVLGVRDHLFEEMSTLRKFSNRISSRLISFAAGTHISDAQTGFRFYHRRLFEGAPWRGSGFDAESAIVVRSARLGFHIESVPIRLARADGRSTSHYRPVVDSARIARAVIRARLAPAG